MGTRFVHFPFPAWISVPLFTVMAEPILLPLPDPEPADNPLAAEPAVLPAEAAEPGEENEVIASLLPCVSISCFAFLASIFGRLVALSLFVRVCFVSVRSIAWF